MDMQYKIIKLQDLEEREQTEGYYADKKKLVSQIKPEALWKNDPLYYNDTGVSSNRILQSGERFQTNSFFTAFEKAYYNHGDICLVPDEIWLVILSFVSKYIDQNSHKLREKLVVHKGVKELIVVQEKTDNTTKLWEEFFELILEEIKKNTVEGVVGLFTCDFSTTQKIHEIISTAMVMNTCKSFFKYTQMMIVCGINNVYMAGTREDWIKIPEKLKKLEQFDVNGDLKKYIENLLVILDNFILTFDNKPNLKWWNSVMKTEVQQLGYMSEAMKVEGWILHFFGLYGKQDSSNFQDLSIMVPIKQIDAVDKTEKNLYLISGFNSVSKVNNRTYKPDIGLSIVEESAINPVKTNNRLDYFDEFDLF